MKILFFDIETSLLKFHGFRLGKQHVQHTQLMKGGSRYCIYTIQYCWNDDQPAKVLVFDYKEGNCAGIIKQFDAIIKQADIVIGKNNINFDNKHINAQRMFHNIPAFPQWIRYVDDLQKRMRQYFNLPSQTLDYISEELGLGGKNDMKFSDWADIMLGSEAEKLCKRVGFEAAAIAMDCIYDCLLTDILARGKIALKKMVAYGKKDVEDTRTIWNYCEKHFETNINYNLDINNPVCKRCGSTDLKLNGHQMSGGKRYQQFQCRTCFQYAGRALKLQNGKLGRIL